MSSGLHNSLVGVLDVFKPELVTKVRERIKALASKTLDGTLQIGRRTHPRLATELDGYINHPMEIVRDKVRGFILSQGQNSIETTAALIHAMLEKFEGQYFEQMQDVVAVVTGHHLFEVGSDAMDSGLENSPERIVFLRRFNCFAEAVARGELRIENINIDELLTGEDIDQIGKLFAKVLSESKSFKMFMEATGTRIEDLEITKITIADLLMLNIAGIAGIREHLMESETPSPSKKLDDFIIDSLARRYSAVQRIIEPTQGYKNMDMMTAIDTREDAILIKVTMGMLVREACVINPELAESLNNNIDDILECMSIAAQLIGIWNDLGSGLMRMTPEEIFKLLNDLGLNENLSRERLAPANYRQRLHDEEATTSELTTIRAKMDANAEETPALKEKWDLMAQLLKDSAKSEPNSALDAAVPDETSRTVLLLRFAEYSKQMEILLGNKLLKFNPVLASIIRNAVIYHAQIYKGGDYYGKVISGLELPVIYGYTLHDDRNLFGGGSVTES